MAEKENLVIVVDGVSVRAVLFDGRRGGRGLCFFDRQPLADDSLETLAAAVAAMVKKGALRHRQAVLVLHRRIAFMRNYSFPSRDPRELRQMFDLNMTADLPFNPDEVVADLVARPAGEGASLVTGFFVEKSVPGRVWKALRRAGFDVTRVTVSSQAIAEWCGEHLKEYFPSSRSGLILDLDRDVTEACFVFEGNAIYSRIIPVGWNAGEPGLDELVRHIKAVLDLYHKLKIAPLPESAIISAPLDFAAAAPLARELGQLTGWEVKVVTAEQLAPGAVYKGGGRDWREMSWIVPAGVCGVSQRTAVDLCPPDILKDRGASESLRVWIRLGLAAAGVILSLFVLLGGMVWQENSELSRLTAEQKSLIAPIKTLSAKEKKLDALRQILQGRVIVAEVIRKIYELSPNSVILVDLQLAGKKLSVQGHTPVGPDVNIFFRRLSGSGMFFKVNLDYVNKREMPDGEQNFFNITCLVGAAK